MFLANRDNLCRFLKVCGRGKDDGRGECVMAECMVSLNGERTECIEGHLVSCLFRLIPSILHFSIPFPFPLTHFWLHACHAKTLPSPLPHTLDSSPSNSIHHTRDRMYVCMYLMQDLRPTLQPYVNLTHRHHGHQSKKKTNNIKYIIIISNIVSKRNSKNLQLITTNPFLFLLLFISTPQRNFFLFIHSVTSIKFQELQIVKVLLSTQYLYVTKVICTIPHGHSNTRTRVKGQGYTSRRE